MAQINLLKQTTSSTNAWEIIPKILVKVLLLVLVLVLAYYAWLFISFNKTVKDIENTKSDIEKIRSTSLNVAGRNEVLTRQLQIKALNEAVNSHIYWSQLMPKLAAVTLKTASYTSMRVNNTGLLTLVVNVPDLESLDKYLQVFNLPEVNKNFSNVLISGYHKVQGENANSINFEVSMKFNPAIIQYSK